MSKHIERILVVNRGEIARRIMRTAHNMGISTVAIYADGDASEPFVKEADQAVALGGTSSLETYLDQAKVLAAAKRTGADAIHPGYGFLSENTTFAATVKDAGLIWIGPNADAISQMGDKLSSKKLMTDAGVPTLPSAEVAAGADAKALAKDIGYPLLVKASAGGGGKGMRVVESDDELDEAVDGARREAAAAFGDDTIFLERWLSSSRHVEIQVMGDEHGNAVHCFERECSIQRRHQKIIEEAPSSAVSPELREKMGAAAVAAARAISYTSAGTVEFLLDGEDFWFLEMNTRLQVEHPVTEEITGLDLVREQILVAQGDQLSFTQDDLVINGHAIEARIYGEDPVKDFLPTAGPVLLFEPSKVADARFDSGIETGSRVGIEFDPMLSKVIVHAPTRAEAALRLARVLETTRIQGLVTNRDFLVSVLRTEAFLDGDTTTDFINRHSPTPDLALTDAELTRAAITAAMWLQGHNRSEATVLSGIPSGWRNARLPAQEVAFNHGDTPIEVSYRSQRDGSFRVNDATDVQVHRWSPDEIDLEIDRRRSTSRVTGTGNKVMLQVSRGTAVFDVVPRFVLPGAEEPTGGLTAPMPGVVLELRVAVGDAVTTGQTLVVLEAMKMEHHMKAPFDGHVAEMLISDGQQVESGAVLLVIDPLETDLDGTP